MKTRWPLFAALPILAIGCAHLDYVGQSYPPTQQVDLYYSEENVGREYTVMGELAATAQEFVSARKIQEQMVEKAKQKGADAVVILGMEHFKSGENTNYSETTTQGTGRKGKKFTTTSGTQSTSVEESKRIRALFVKYKAPAAQP